MTSSIAREDTAAPSQPRRGGEFYIPSIDGMRAVSFLLVFMAHSGLEVPGVPLPGGLGVTIFFFLSGYLITTLLRLEHDRTSRISLRDFYVRRAFRIWPPFYVVLTLAIVATLLDWLPEPLKVGSVAAQLAHVTNYWFIFRDTHGFPAGTVVYWSLAVEEHFYLVFPCVFILLQRWFGARQRPQASVLLALCAVVLAWRFFLVWTSHPSEARTSWASDTRIDSILFGCLLAVSGNPMMDAWRGSKRLWTYVLLPLGLAMLAFSMVYRAGWFRETLRYSLQGLALIPIFVTAIRYPSWGPMRVLNWRVSRWFGLLSYSLYLCHQAILIGVYRQLGQRPALVATLSFAASVLLAWGIHHLVEKPSARARRRFVTTAWLKPVVREDGRESA